MSVFVTDADYKHTLGTVRCLGRRGLLVDVGSPSSRITLSSFSRYAHNVFKYYDPEPYPERFARFIRAICKKYKYEVVIPVGYNATFALSRFKRNLLKDINIPIASCDSLKIAGNKRETIKLAQQLDIPAPKTMVSKFSDLERIGRGLKYPVVVKGIYGSGCVRYAYSGQDLKRKFAEIYNYQGVSPLVQEFVKGEGYGFFALFKHGELKATFMHKRIREYPAGGGPSTCAESVYEPKLKQYGLRILKSLNWHGVAMVEFRKDANDGGFKIMEINPKFWGSLDLAIASGVDFPYLLYKMAVDGDVRQVFNYKVGVRFMWPFPDDFLRTLSRPQDLIPFIKDLFDTKVVKNIVMSDVKPNLYQILASGISLGSQATRHFRT